jgi:hypothetical protein
MNGAVEDLLREGLDRLTADVQVPPGVTGRARTHLRRKKIAVRAALAGGVVAVTAAAVVAATLPGQGSAGLFQVQTSAYVVARVVNALAATNQVVQTETTFSGPYPPVMSWNYRKDMRVTQSGFIAPALMPESPWAQGRVHWEVGTMMVHGRQKYVRLDYRRHEWSNAGLLGFEPNGCTTMLWIVEFNLPSNWTNYLRQALSCGVFKVTGHAQVDGVRTIKLTGSMTDKTFWRKLPHGLGRGPLRIDATLYVNPKTYLPVLVIWNNRAHYRDGRPLDGTVRQEITALPRTARNIAKANVTVPAGFRQVPDGTFGGPLSAWFNSR